MDPPRIDGCLPAPAHVPDERTATRQRCERVGRDIATNNNVSVSKDNKAPAP